MQVPLYVVLILVIVLILVMIGNQVDIMTLVAAAAAIMIASVVAGQYGEKFTDNVDPYSKYGNISLDGDIDMSEQEVIDPSLTGNGTARFDNSDAIAAVISGGTTLFHPDGRGFSPTSNHGNVPERFSSQYDIPLSGKQNLDERFARKQQQRSDINKRAIDGSVRATRELYNKYFTEELNENEERVWYSAEANRTGDDWSQIG